MKPINDDWKSKKEWVKKQSVGKLLRCSYFKEGTQYTVLFNNKEYEVSCLDEFIVADDRYISDENIIAQAKKERRRYIIALTLCIIAIIALSYIKYNILHIQ